MGPYGSPSLALEDDDFEFEEICFRDFYKPLSNLPTPPLSIHTSSASQSPEATPQNEETLNSQYLGPAAHLVRMLPPGSSSFITPSRSIVQNILLRANLSMDIIALAVCILDSLDAKFSRNWRISFPLNIQGHSTSKRHTMPSIPVRPGHISSVSPEVIILASLIIARKFVDDVHQPTQSFRTQWGESIWTCDEINFTERCIMENLNYRIFPLWNPELIKEARHDIELARREIIQESSAARDEGKKHLKSMSSGNAIVGLGLQLTPAATPRTETPPFVNEL
ncbi:hypothetical protein GGR57DRAFT_448046 [Xylariaceae sp. FL1272]|nr:hypothetical protein GGR57DRAFT_448046 [Xylariaceae sp. FL1272]